MKYLTLSIQQLLMNETYLDEVLDFKMRRTLMKLLTEYTTVSDEWDVPQWSTWLWVYNSFWWWGRRQGWRSPGSPTHMSLPSPLGHLSISNTMTCHIIKTLVISSKLVISANLSVNIHAYIYNLPCLSNLCVFYRKHTTSWIKIISQPQWSMGDSFYPCYNTNFIFT